MLICHNLCQTSKSPAGNPVAYSNRVLNITGVHLARHSNMCVCVTAQGTLRCQTYKDRHTHTASLNSLADQPGSWQESL